MNVMTKENIAEPMKDIRRALLEADVSLPVVRRFVQSVSDQAVGMGVIRGVKPDQQLVKVDKGMMDELKDVKRFLNPTETLLVVDAMTGQEAACNLCACRHLLRDNTSFYQ
ncbi:hypothetical protein Rs2_00366 [Raphanus sativus]|nr:hypothetical protein Rs2_00366 [Raphanus sativus]